MKLKLEVLKSDFQHNKESYEPDKLELSGKTSEFNFSLSLLS